MQNDTYWLINTGKYYVEAGFPHIEPFTMHEELFFTAQQWLSSVIFYFLFEFFGEVGIYIFTIIVYYAISLLVYRLCLFISNGNRFISVIIALTSCVFSSFFMVPRPQVFSTLIFLCLIFVLEKYISNQKSIYLLLLPFLSLLLVNIHSAMWLFFFVLLIPYIIDGVKTKLPLINTQGYGYIKIIAAALVSFAVGFINPYGIKNMLYLINSYGNKTVSSSVNEMMSPDFKGIFGIIIFIILLAFFLIHIKIKGNTTLRYSLITIGTLYMALSSVRSFALFFVIGLPLVVFYIKDINITLTSTLTGWKKYTLISLLSVIIIYTPFTKKYDYTDNMNEFRPIKAIEYLKNNTDVSKIRLYNDYNTGGYIEFCGIKAFIDSRAEIFLKSFNKKDDIIIDYLDMKRSKLHYMKFIEKYNFSHFLVSKDDSLDTYLREDKNFQKVYEDNLFKIYRKIL